MQMIAVNEDDSNDDNNESENRYNTPKIAYFEKIHLQKSKSRNSKNNLEHNSLQDTIDCITLTRRTMMQ